ncbi:MAG: DMT family transporter [Pseudoflavonifractor sp.]|nr:DMT family transporter [Alloprevotella sp.]MCM1116805.1 DMT family transporter [Pseudoflavonifractor sp.]
MDIASAKGLTGQSGAVMAAAVAVVSWSTVAAAFKTALNYYTTYEMVTVASITATLIYGMAVTLRGRWADVKRLSLTQLRGLVVEGLFNPAAYYLILFAAYDMLPAQVAQPINYCWPIFLTLLMAIVMRRRVKPRLYIGMAVSLAGVAIISLGGGGLPEGSLSVGGLLMAFASAALWAVYWIINERVGMEMDESVKLFVSFAIASVVLLAVMPFTDATFASIDGLWASVYIGVFEMGVPFLFFSMALRMATNVAIVNQMCYIAPFLSLFFISMVVGESIVAFTYVGLALIIVGVVYNKYASGREA